MNTVAVFLLAVITSPCISKTIPEEDSVVSVYTTQATTSGTSGLDVYQQIAHNVAERITSPFYRLFNVQRNKTDNQPITKKPWQKIELLDEPTTRFKEDNDIDDRNLRDTEELSADALRKADKKPEKITLYTSYLPVKSQNIEQVDLNDTMNSIDDDDVEDELTLDDVDTGKDSPREGPFIYFLELLGSFIQLLSGALSWLFPSSSSSSSSQT
ncbi:hypothetical protein O0L34_g14206 [Tuta absoluta]|nr:hypothetical protein O0L34_g14206 [Tuta absoluta]